MMTVYKASEVYDIGIAIEKNGARFYEEAAAAQQDQEIAEFFTTLAKLENAHVELWEELKGRLAENPPASSPDDSDDQAQRSLKVTADNHVFVKSKAILSQVLRCKTVEEVLKLAMVFEKDSVDFYMALSEAPPTKWDKEKIEDLIQEERRHIEMIQEKLDLLG